MKIFKLKSAITTLAFIFIALGLAFIPKPAFASYDGGNIIDDYVFLNASSMSANDIQNFLVSKGGGLANKTFLFDCAATDLSDPHYRDARAPCEQTVKASVIIYYASQIFGINPQVVLATLQKEQSLITTADPTDWQINQAMGYACPDHGGCGASNFLYQIDNGVYTLRLNMERAKDNMTWWWHQTTTWVCGYEHNYYKPSLFPNQNVNFYDDDGTYYQTQFIANAATSSLYCYTPHAYNNPNGLYGYLQYGTTGPYYSGSYLFVTSFEKWFGSIHRKLVTSDFQSIYLVENGTKRLIPSAQVFSSYSYKWADILQINDAELQNIPNGKNVEYYARYREYKLVTSDFNRIYLVENGAKRLFPSGEVFSSWPYYKWADVIKISDVEIGLMPDGPAMFYNVHSRDGQIVKTSNSDGVYKIENGTKHPFPDGLTFASYGLKWADIVAITSSELNLIPDGLAMTAR